MNEQQFEALNNPPILETALNVSLQREHFDKKELENIISEIAPNALSQKEVFEDKIEYKCLVNGERDVRETREFLGMRVAVEKNLVISILNLKSANTILFACSILPPYSSWNDFINRSLPLLQKFITIAKSERILRMGVRSIDRIIVKGLSPLVNYLRAMPPSPLEKGGALIDNFLYQESFYYIDTKLRASLVRRAEEVAGEKKSFIIDTDVYAIANERELRYPIEDRLLEDMHKLRNELFFGTIGSSALEEARKQ